MLPKAHRLPSFEIRKVLFGGKRIAAEGISITIRKNSLPLSRFTVSVPLKAAKRATRRNRTKRLIRESIRHLLGKIMPGYDGVIIVMRDLFGQKQSQVEELVKRMFEKIRLVA